MNLPQPLWDRVVHYVGFEQNLIKMKKRDWRFEEARAYLNRLHHLYMCIRTSAHASRPDRMERLRKLMKFYERQHLKPRMLHMILMGQLHRKMCCTDRRRHRYVEMYILYKHLKRFIKKPQRVFYPYIEYTMKHVV